MRSTFAMDTFPKVSRNNYQKDRVVSDTDGKIGHFSDMAELSAQKLKITSQHILRLCKQIGIT